MKTAVMCAVRCDGEAIVDANRISVVQLPSHARGFRARVANLAISRKDVGALLGAVLLDGAASAVKRHFAED
jgi:hypothetical protein